MIEPTDEMLNAYRDAVRRGGDNTDDIRRAGLAAVLALVERDYVVFGRRPPIPKPLERQAVAPTPRADVLESCPRGWPESEIHPGLRDGPCGYFGCCTQPGPGEP